MTGTLHGAPTSRREAEDLALARVIARLRDQFPEIAPDEIERIARGEADRFDGRPVRDFVPILVERAARGDLSGRRRRA